jgi:hypothetical protein
MISRHMIEELRRMNSGDQTTFRRWLTLNTVVGAVLLTLMAAAALVRGGESSPPDTAAYDRATQRAEAK